MKPFHLQLSGSCEVKAAAGKGAPTISGVAYTGDQMTPMGFSAPVVVDLAGLQIAGGANGVPLLSDHDTSMKGIIGHGAAAVVKDQLYFNGTLADTEAAKEIVRITANGFTFQASIGAEPLKEGRFYKPGESVKVNGRTFKAGERGLRVLDSVRLREVSITAIGADPGTFVTIKASFNSPGRKSKMSVDANEDLNQTNEKDSTDELIRIEKIKAKAANYARSARTPEIVAQAISEGWDERQAELEMLRAARPIGPGIQVARPDEVFGASREMFAAAWTLKMAGQRVAEKAFDARTLEAAHRLGRSNSMDIVEAHLRASGVERPQSRNEMVKLAFQGSLQASSTTLSLPFALGNAANKTMEVSYNESPASWRKFSRIVIANDFKSHTLNRVEMTGNLKEVGPTGELKHGGYTEAATSFSIATFGKIVGLTRTDIINDDLGVFADTAAALGRSAARTLNDLVYTVLLANSGSFFSTGNGNYQEGAGTVLSIDALAAAVTLMRKQVDSENNNLDFTPTILLTPPELETAARSLLNSEFIQRANDDETTGNSLRNIAELAVEPRLSNSAKFGASALSTHWYLFSAAHDGCMIVAFLNGQQSPTIEPLGIDANPSQLALQWRVYHDFGAKLHEKKAGVRSKGAA